MRYVDYISALAPRHQSDKDGEPTTAAAAAAAVDGRIAALNQQEAARGAPATVLAATTRATRSRARAGADGCATASAPMDVPRTLTRAARSRAAIVTRSDAPDEPLPQPAVATVKPQEGRGPATLVTVPRSPPRSPAAAAAEACEAAPATVDVVPGKPLGASLPTSDAASPPTTNGHKAGVADDMQLGAPQQEQQQPQPVTAAAARAGDTAARRAAAAQRAQAKMEASFAAAGLTGCAGANAGTSRAMGAAGRTALRVARPGESFFSHNGVPESCRYCCCCYYLCTVVYWHGLVLHTWRLLMVVCHSCTPLPALITVLLQPSPPPRPAVSDRDRFTTVSTSQHHAWPWTSSCSRLGGSAHDACCGCCDRRSRSCSRDGLHHGRQEGCCC